MYNHVSILPTVTFVYGGQSTMEMSLSELLPDAAILKIRLTDKRNEDVTLGDLRRWAEGRHKAAPLPVADTHCTCGAPLPCGWCVPPTKRSPHASVSRVR